MIYLKYLLFFLSTSSMAQITLTDRVMDQANILSASEKTELETLLSEYEKKTSNQIVVLTIDSLGEQTIEDFGYQQARKWALGTKEKNNGVLFIVAVNDRQVRIEVGYGLEDVLTDAQSKMIIERNIVPYFKQGKMDQGVLQGTFAIVRTLGGDVNSLIEEKSKQDDPSDVWSIAAFFLLIGFLIFFSRWLRKRRGPRSPYGGGGFWRGGSGGGGGGGGFRGGGGSFGGGGSSGKWTKRHD